MYKNTIVCDSQEDLYDKISSFIDSNCEITQDENIIKYLDKNNSNRLLSKLMSMYYGKNITIPLK